MKIVFVLAAVVLCFALLGAAHSKPKNKMKFCDAQCQSECGDLGACKRNCSASCVGARAHKVCMRNCKVNTCMRHINTECEACRDRCFDQALECRTTNCSEVCASGRKPKKNRRCKSCIRLHCRGSE